MRPCASSSSTAAADMLARSVRPSFAQFRKAFDVPREVGIPLFGRVDVDDAEFSGGAGAGYRAAEGVRAMDGESPADQLERQARERVRDTAAMLAALRRRRVSKLLPFVRSDRRRHPAALDAEIDSASRACAPEAGPALQPATAHRPRARRHGRGYGHLAGRRHFLSHRRGDRRAGLGRRDVPGTRASSCRCAAARTASSSAQTPPDSIGSRPGSTLTGLDRTGSSAKVDQSQRQRAH